MNSRRTRCDGERRGTGNSAISRHASHRSGAMGAPGCSSNDSSHTSCDRARFESSPQLRRAVPCRGGYGSWGVRNRMRIFMICARSDRPARSPEPCHPTRNCGRVAGRAVRSLRARRRSTTPRA